MKKYLIIFFLFLLAVSPAIAKGPSSNSNQPTVQTTNTPSNGNSSSTPSNNQNKSNITPSPKTTITPTGNQVKNQNQVQIKNQGEDKDSNIKTQETQTLNKNLDENFSKVSDQVKELINTVGSKTGIGQQVKEIAQNQTKVQENLKSNLAQLQFRKSFVKFFLGSDKKTLKNIEQHLEENQLLVKQLEELKTQTKNTADLEQIQQTIDLMTYQNTSLQEKITQDGKVNGLFGWLTKLFNK